MLSEAVIKENFAQCVLRISTKCLSNTNKQKIHTYFLVKSYCLQQPHDYELS